MTVYASSGTSYTTTATYEDTGSVLTSTGPTGTTTLSYDSTFSYLTGSQLPTPSSGVTISNAATYDTSYTGLGITSTDPNTRQTSYTYSDPFLRPTKAAFPDGGSATVDYLIYSSSQPTQVGQQTYQSASVYSDVETQYDGYGRPSRAEVADGSVWYQSDTCYDDNGNAVFTSYPYQGSGISLSKGCSVSGSTVTSTVSGDTYSFDVLGRVTKVVRANGETLNYTYLGRAVESVDENGVTRISQADGLGRTTLVCEVASLGTMLGTPSPGGCSTDASQQTAMPQPTTTLLRDSHNHGFPGRADAHLRFRLAWPPDVCHGTGVRIDNLRLRVQDDRSSRSHAPGRGPIRQARRPLPRPLQYDSLGRVVTISYNDGVTPTKTFLYDTSTGVSTGTGAKFTDLTQVNLKGRLSLASVSNAGTAFSYDPVGRANYLDECLPSGPCSTVTYNRQLHYTYDWAGNILTSTDGSSTSTTYTQSRANEVLSMTSSLSNSTNPANIVSSVQNGPNGPVSYNLGNALSSVYGYDTLGRLNGGWVCSGSTSPSCSGGTQKYGFTNGWKGVQVTGTSDSVLAQGSTYGYDGFNRLASRTVNSGTGPNYAWVYDRWGNRWQQNITGGTGSGPAPQLTFNTANNQISTSGFTYDAAGNMTNDSSHSYTYDAEGNITQVDSGSTATQA